MRKMLLCKQSTDCLCGLDLLLSDTSCCVYCIPHIILCGLRLLLLAVYVLLTAHAFACTADWTLLTFMPCFTGNEHSMLYLGIRVPVSRRTSCYGMEHLHDHIL